MSVFIKLYPYIFFLGLWNYCVRAAINAPDILTTVVAIITLALQVVFLLVHEFINESLKFREIDYCNSSIVSYTGALLQVVAILALQLFGIFYATICYYLIAIYDMVRLFSTF
jgi:hypothetical protein